MTKEKMPVADEPILRRFVLGIMRKVNFSSLKNVCIIRCILTCGTLVKKESEGRRGLLVTIT